MVQRLQLGHERTRRQRDLSARINALNTASDSEQAKAVEYTVRLDVRLQHDAYMETKTH